MHGREGMGRMRMGRTDLRRMAQGGLCMMYKGL